MGLTSSSTGAEVNRAALRIQRTAKTEKVVALAGNPNVGKSTVFNALTKMRQHTGNWCGKTVACALGTYTYRGGEYILADIPGAYSLSAASAEEEAARDFLFFGGADVTVVVCSASALERNMNLVLQTLEITPRVILAVNLMDEAAGMGITVDLGALERMLGIPAVGLTALRNEGIDALAEAVRTFPDTPSPVCRVRYPDAVEDAAAALEMHLANVLGGKLDARRAALCLLEDDASLIAALKAHLGFDFAAHPAVAPVLARSREKLTAAGLSPSDVREGIVTAIYETAARICSRAVTRTAARNDRQLKADRLLTHRFVGAGVMLLLLAIVFFITINGANAASDVLFSLFSSLGGVFDRALTALGAPPWLHGALTDGVWRVLSWVVAVMLPPMAIFFPLFTLLEDLGYLPRAAFCLDEAFRRCGACGKQALTMCMGFGCNAAGVTGCRIIDSPRERLIATLTNCLVPCNGRFPLLITLISVFITAGAASSVLSALALTGAVLFSAALTFFTSWLLSKTLLRGVPSSLTLELPPFRAPRIGSILVRSVLDRTLFVLGRAAVTAAPAGLLIWLTANVTVDGETVLSLVTDFLDPFARLFGLDGVILTAFILGIPANETVLPIAVMAYLATGTITALPDTASLGALLAANGWTWRTALCVTVFTLAHWPCATTLLTVKKETGSLKWTVFAFLIPTVLGMILCASLNALLFLV